MTASEALDNLIANLADDYEDAGEINLLYIALHRLEVYENQNTLKGTTS
jgi:hypothetical protein